MSSVGVLCGVQGDDPDAELEEEEEEDDDLPLTAAAVMDRW